MSEHGSFYLPGDFHLSVFLEIHSFMWYLILRERVPVMWSAFNHSALLLYLTRFHLTFIITLRWASLCLTGEALESSLTLQGHATRKRLCGIWLSARTPSPVTLVFTGEHIPAHCQQALSAH